MGSRTLELAVALASRIASLHASTPFAADIAPAAVWVHRYDKAALGTVKFSVVPGPIEIQPIGRVSPLTAVVRTAQRRELDLVTQQNVDPTALASVDALVELQEQLPDRLVGLELFTASGKTALCTAAEMVTPDKAMVDKTELQNLRVFTAVVRTSWSFRQ